MPDDLHLVIRLKGGDEEAFAELVHLYQKRIYAMLYQMTGNHFEADDLSQEAFLRAYTYIDSFKGGSSFQTWLYRIARNLAFTHLKKRGRKNTLILNEFPGENLLESKTDNPMRSLMHEELRFEITAAINSLPLFQREVAVLLLLQELSYREVAEIQGCAEGTVAWRFYQARRRLIKILGPLVDKMRYKK
ncbi:MAG: sigma-70 family RNA polymerase sigma factor [Candidatus Ratteibacteria bacterium]|jgi:RNA polymerase sigma-70 factor (ECF subfamily)